MTTKFINVVCKLESEYGSVLNVPDDNPALVKIQRYWKTHPDSVTREESTYYDNGPMQVLLDKGYPKSWIADKVNVPLNVLNYRVDMGILSTKKWKQHKMKLFHNQIFRLYHNGHFDSEGTVEEISMNTGRKCSTIYNWCHSDSNPHWKAKKIGDNAEWVKIR